MLLMDYLGNVHSIADITFMKICEVSGIKRNDAGELVSANTFAVFVNWRGNSLDRRFSHEYPDREHAQSALAQFTKSPTPLFFWEQPSTTKRRRRKTWKPQDEEWK